MFIEELSAINRRVREEPEEFVKQCEADYARKIEETAQAIAKRSKISPIALISGPTASGKTTTAKRIESRLGALGIKVHLISMDDYFMPRGSVSPVLDNEGKEDLESPECLDIKLLSKHLSMLSEGDEILLPDFCFKTQCRTEKVTPLRLKKDEVAVIEGIHALNEELTGGIGEKAVKIYISIRIRIGDGGKVLMHPECLRLMRRMVRDKQFRGAPAEKTLDMWKSVSRGEKLYILPYKHSANIEFDTFLGYEVCVLIPATEEDFKRVSPELIMNSNSAGILDVIGKAETLSRDLIPPDSLLREFIGGGSIDY